jgi:hypothetical protein
MASSLPLPDFVSEGLEMFHLLKALVDQGHVVILFFDGQDYQVTHERRTVERTRLAEAIQDAARGHAILKRCSKCGQEKELHQFPRDKNRPDEHFHACRTCERVRWANVKRKTRAAKAGMRDEG